MRTRAEPRHRCPCCLFSHMINLYMVPRYVINYINYKDAVLKNNLSLLEGLQFTPPSSARTKGDDTRYYVHTYLVRTPTFSFWFSVSWDIPTSAFFHSRAYVQHFMIPGMCYVPDAYDTRYVLLYRYLFIRAWVAVRMTPTFRPTNSCIASGWW